MKIALVSSMVPFVDGGGRQIVDWLAHTLIQRGHKVEKVYLPEVDSPKLIEAQMTAFRLVDLSMADLVICVRPQSHVIKHSNKVLWFIHHIRTFYDLWGSDYQDFADTARHEGIRASLHRADTNAMNEARKIFSNSGVVAGRLKQFNNIDSEILYPPILNPERFCTDGYNDEIVYISRISRHKRQHLMVEALGRTKSPVRLRICGTSEDDDYVDQILSLASELGVGDRLVLENRWINDEEKVLLLSQCLAVAYVPFDEDSYGYPTLEAAHSAKATITTVDSGGVVEFVEDTINGFICEPRAENLAERMDELWENRDLASAQGAAAKDQINRLNISWDNVVTKLLS